MSEVDELRQRIERIEQALFPLARPTPYLPTPVSFQCPTCGMKFEGAMGYVCPNARCPVQARATC